MVDKSYFVDLNEVKIVENNVEQNSNSGLDQNGSDIHILATSFFAFETSLKLAKHLKHRML